MFFPKDEILGDNEKYRITNNSDGTVGIQMVSTIVQEGTKITKDVLASGIGFDAKSTTFNEDGSITETNGTVIKTTIFNDDGSITETLTDGLDTMSKQTIFNSDGTIDEIVYHGTEE